MLGFMASIGLAVALAILLDQLDKRFRYPDQVTRELGLTILGAVPALKRGKDGLQKPEDAAQTLEAFRSHPAQPGPLLRVGAGAADDYQPGTERGEVAHLAPTWPAPSPRRATRRSSSTATSGEANCTGPFRSTGSRACSTTWAATPPWPRFFGRPASTD